MKEVIFIRHAKSDWDNPRLRDIERPLSERGVRDAPIMANKLKILINSVDLMISSPAVRALQTASYFAQIYNYAQENIEIYESLYEAYTDDIIEVVKSIDSNNINQVLFFGHNPGYTHLANMFSSISIENVPTCGIFKLNADVQKWREISTENTKLDFFIKP
jgi:phosphohistidine phosphatase